MAHKKTSKQLKAVLGLETIIALAAIMTLFFVGFVWQYTNESDDPLCDDGNSCTRDREKWGETCVHYPLKDGIACTQTNCFWNSTGSGFAATGAVCDSGVCTGGVCAGKCSSSGTCPALGLKKAGGTNLIINTLCIDKVCVYQTDTIDTFTQNVIANGPGILGVCDGLKSTSAYAGCLLSTYDTTPACTYTFACGIPVQS